METTFMTIHNLTPEANILFASESIVDVLGYQPYEVIGKSCFDYFHPQEVPFAKDEHRRSLQLDKASVLHYSMIKARDGVWVSCECVFSVVHDVLVACTSIYQQSMNSERRRLEAPQIRRIFASSPRDPRYHMLEHLSAKFRTSPLPTIREPRAALILNRFSRTLSIMYSTNAIFDVIGVTADEVTGKSFYECIAEDCLPDAIRSLESAKANDSIAYLRFRYRDPRRAEELEQMEREASHSDESEDGGVPIDAHMSDADGAHTSSSEDQVVRSHSPESSAPMNLRTDSGGSTDHEDVFDNEPRSSSGSAGRPVRAHRGPARHTPIPAPPIELEAVVSCTSDGLVVILRRARPALHVPAAGIFAAPWGAQEIIPNMHARVVPVQGPSEVDFMSSIREVAVFAWSLTGINGNIANYSHGIPRGEAVPPTGFPIYDPHAQDNKEMAPENQAKRKWQDLHGVDDVEQERRGWKYDYGGDHNQSSTNEPGSGKQPPYQHAREEMRFREQNGYTSTEAMGSDAPGSAALQHVGGLIGSAGHATSHDQNTAQEPHQQYSRPTQGETSTPTQSQNQPQEQGQSNRHMWY